MRNRDGILTAILMSCSEGCKREIQRNDMKLKHEKVSYVTCYDSISLYSIIHRLDNFNS